MKEHILMLSESTSLLCLIAIFILLFVIILKSLKQASIFGKIGLRQTFVPTENVSYVSENSSNHTPELDLILLLYAALAIALLLSPFLWFMAKMFHSDKCKKGSKRFNHRPEKCYPFRGLYKPSVKRDEDRFTKFKKDSWNLGLGLNSWYD